MVKVENDDRPSCLGLFECQIDGNRTAQGFAINTVRSISRDRVQLGVRRTDAVRCTLDRGNVDLDHLHHRLLSTSGTGCVGVIE